MKTVVDDKPQDPIKIPDSEKKGPPKNKPDVEKPEGPEKDDPKDQ